MRGKNRTTKDADARAAHARHGRGGTNCESVRSLLSSYVDGELSEEQAAPMRAHLIDCPGCRESIQEGRAIRRWFAVARSERVVVPQGFAARVARRAFAGDPGLAPTGRGEEAAAKGSLLPFVLGLSAAAAAVLFALSLLIQSRSLPESQGIEAVETYFWEQEEPGGVRDDVPSEAEDDVPDDEEPRDATGAAAD